MEKMNKKFWIFMMLGIFAFLFMIIFTQDAVIDSKEVLRL